MKKALFAFVFAIAIFSASAKSFSLQVVQKNTPGDEVFDSSYVVEQAILDYFFEQGMIVSNGAVLVSKDDAAKNFFALDVVGYHLACKARADYVKLVVASIHFFPP